ncbi:16S rRNA (cytidine(1402)-2'-O)-methyltransferase [Jatrophihabitans sp. YIM 134969]
MTGRLLLAATPIGNAADASPRLGTALATAPVVAAEDTRRLARLTAALGVTTTGRVVSFFEGNEAGRVPQLVEAMTAGDDVVLVTDAGMPSVSDPGYRLVVAAVAAGLEVTVLPGPSAVTAALAVSGLPTDRFCFEGFPPRKAGERARTFAALASDPRTSVFFESPRRLAETLAAMAEAFGADRPAAVCRELTKTHEEIRRGPLAELAAWAAAGEPRGEICVVVGGATATGGDLEPERIAELVAARIADGLSRRDAAAEVAAEYGLRRRDVYQVALDRP